MVAVLVIFAAAPAAAFAVTGYLDSPVDALPLPGRSSPAVSPSTGDIEAPEVAPPDLIGEVGTLVDDADGGGGTAGGGGGAPGSGGGGTPGPSASTGSGGSPTDIANDSRTKAKGSAGGSASDPDPGSITPTGAREAGTSGPSGVLKLARPLAPAVVIAVLGLLMLASAARGNDRLIKREKESSRAGAWRL